MSTPFDEIRPRRNNLGVRLASYFVRRGVGAEAAASIAAGSFIHRHPAGPTVLGRRPDYVDIIVDGIVCDADGPRLWASDHWLGDLDLFQESNLVLRTWVDFLCPTWTVRISRDVLRSWAMRDLSVQRMVHNVFTARLSVQDIVYGLDQRPTLARVAQLLDYLSHQPESVKELGIRPHGTTPVVHGPTQRHLAEALGLSLGSVEKSMNTLRKHGVLASSGGGRANRTYRIMKHEMLDIVAQGAALEAA
ncbi:hypothetical protein ABT117_32980 [Streptomyces sp. NPDC002262]|uniref:Crp/Fnr family transcriptional regulator n=1 Tax=Streptomyces sp. NPDC002262 TaxID=3154414 RepID=UPI00331909AB